MPNGKRPHPLNQEDSNVKKLLFVIALVLVTVPTIAQDKPATPSPTASTAPSLTSEQKKDFALLIQRLELNTLKIQAAQSDFEIARQQLTQLVQTLQVAGYDLDLQKLEYVKKPDPKPEPKKQ